MRWILVLVFAAAGFSQSEPPAGWSAWAARPEIAPRTFVEGSALAISGASNAAAYGGWERSMPVEAGRWYRLAAFYRAEGLTYERGQVVARIDWRAGAKRAGQPEYAWRTEREGAKRRVIVEAPAPEGATAAVIQLYLSNAPQATVWWDDISFEAIPAPASRPVTIASINFRPKGTRSAQESVGQFLDVIEKSVPQNADIIVLPEGITVVGTGLKYADVAETIPGPTTARLAEAARRHKAYVAAGIYERDGHAIYNTAVLLDRSGAIAGKYRKVYLPREEIEGGITPGLDYPMFRTDFGTLGMMICWDVQYADPARGLALRGAELLLMPIWGGNQTLAKARAIENHVFIAASGYDFPTQVLDPAGEVIAAAKENGTAAVATIDLNRRYPDPWLGEMRGRFMKEIRLDVPMVP